MLSKALDWIYPPKCGLCGRFGPAAICAICLAEFQPQDRQMKGLDGPVMEAAALYRYESRAAQAVRRLKYTRITPLIDPLAELIRDGYERFDLHDYDAIVPIPIHWRRRVWRGFNQAEALASQLPQDRVRLELLVRVKATKPQVKLTREERMTNLIGAFEASPEVRDQSILLIDDVRTSGHTSEQCALALLEKGAERVGLLTLTGE